jgi:hypothetical protein
VLLSTEAKYITGTHTVKELIWLRELLARLDLTTNLPTTLLMDNQSAIAIAKNPTFHECTKHIEVCYHFLKKMVKDGKIKLEYIPTTEQLVDAMTKGLACEKHKLFIGQMGLCHLG